MKVVILKNDFIFVAPREIAASSILIGICCKIATEDRIVYGSLRMTSAMTIISIVPLINNGGLLKPINKAIPNTVPGTIYGIIDKMSTTLVSIFLKSPKDT